MYIPTWIVIFAVALYMALLSLIAWTGRHSIVVPREEWDHYKTLAAKGADTVVRIDTVWARDTIRLLRPVPLAPRVALADSSHYYVDERADSTLWLRIADTVRAGRIVHRDVQYQLLAPRQLIRSTHVTQYVPVGLRTGFQPPQAYRYAPSRWGGFAAVGVDWSAGLEARAGLRYGHLHLGASVRRQPSGTITPGLWAGWGF